jgi:hypothetical protein
MQTYYMKETVEIPGIENVMLHTDKKIRYTILRDRKNQSVGDHSEAVCGDFRSVSTPLLEIIVMMDDAKEDSCIKTVDQITYNSGFTSSGRDPVVAV